MKGHDEIFDFLMTELRQPPNDVLSALRNSVKTGGNIMLFGPPGVGKTMMGRRLACGRPFRSPHHTCGYLGVIGSYSPAKREIRPGEYQRAQGGILFLDEISEFQLRVIEGLKSLIADGGLNYYIRAGKESVTIHHSIVNPPIIVGTTNPCPCGYRDHSRRACSCPDSAVYRWEKRIDYIMDALRMRRVDIRDWPMAMKSREAGERND